jgi:hypothetical protein
VLRVVGRTSLSPRHTVHLLSVGARVLIVGTGPQGAPSLLGELTDPDDLQRLVPRAAEDEAEMENEGEDLNEWVPTAPSLLDRLVAAWRRFRPAGDDQ